MHQKVRKLLQTRDALRRGMDDRNASKSWYSRSFLFAIMNHLVALGSPSRDRRGLRAATGHRSDRIRSASLQTERSLVRLKSVDPVSCARHGRCAAETMLARNQGD